MISGPGFIFSKNKTKCIPIWAFCLLLGPISPASAQLSPGKLSQPHEHLEGLTKCSQCHQLGNRDVRDKCLDCHGEIAAMVDGVPGLHAAKEYSNCVDCHVEHQGRDYDLVFWSEGRDQFKHQVTGYELKDSHAKLDCRKCHNAEKISNPGPLQVRQKDLDRTYLGLDPACATCHQDIHQGQFKSDCTSCHDATVWKPAPLFDHAKTAYPLTGKHQKVDCAKCHKPVQKPAQKPVEAPAAVRFAGLTHNSCTDCHKDPHNGALGADCTTCHTTDNWLQVNGERFDHNRTKYPLEGRHAAVSCGKCHGQGRKKPAYAACTDCHQDTHLAQATQKPQLLACEKCHTVQDFKPSEFTLTQHEQTKFPLQGAHLATPCLACHIPGTNQKANLSPKYETCTACHKDPHQGKMDRFTQNKSQACTACHTQDTWRVADFKHDQTGFVLDGRHAQANCASCHKPDKKSQPKADFTGLKSACATCHDDVHQKQFANRMTADGKYVDCQVCHVTVDWLAEKFDHEKDSRFSLKGGHENVACNKCHLPASAENPRLLEYKPLPVSCKECHVGTLPTMSDKEKS